MVTLSPFAGREFGILLHPSSLFGREDIGTLGAEAYGFVDWLASTGAGIWQILPLTPNGQYDSPYFSYSAFAGNPWLVDLTHLHSAGLLATPVLHEDATGVRVPFAELARTKRPQLLQAAETLLAKDDHRRRARPRPPPAAAGVWCVPTRRTAPARRWHSRAAPVARAGLRGAGG